MEKGLKIVSLIGKVLAIVGGIGWPEIVGPKTAVIIFMVSSTLKDIVNRLGDYLDDGQLNQSYKG